MPDVKEVRYLKDYQLKVIAPETLYGMASAPRPAA